MANEVTLTVKEAYRVGIIEETLEGRMTVRAAAAILGLTERQIYRLRRRVRSQGAQGIRHGNRGRPPAHTLSEDLRRRVVDLYETTYNAYNFTHFTEVLEEEHEIVVSHDTVSRWLRSEGLGRPPRRAKKHRKRRLRKAHEGEMLFLDGSPHHWFGEDHPPCTLLLVCDDATGKPLAGLFREQEDRDGCFLVLAQVFKRFGLPQSFYLDRASQFKTTRHGGVHSLQGAQELTQFQRAMAELRIELIFARSPQARGRIERMNGLFQDRLVPELNHHKITALPEANRYLRERFIRKIAKRFAVSPRQAISGWRPLLEEVDLLDILCVKAERTVANDNTISYHNTVFQLYPAHGRSHFAKAQVEVRQRPDGRIRIFHPTLGRIRARRVSETKNDTGSIDG